LPVEECRPFEDQLYKSVETMNPGLLKAIAEKKALDDNMKSEMRNIIGELKQRLAGERQLAAARP